jgi:oligopeptide transport system substrate-binding protein
MKATKLLTLLALSFGLTELNACSKSTPVVQNQDKTTINVDIGDDAPTIDPVMAQDTTSARVLYDLFAQLVDFDQSNNIIPGLAKSWNISPDGKTYTFHLRDGLKFSDGSPLTANDVVFSWQRVADPKNASPYNMLIANLTNGQAIIDGKAQASTLGIKALDSKTIQVNLTHPDSAFLQICTMPNLAVVSKDNITKFASEWVNPKNMVTSGAYTIKEWVIKGHMLVVKNPNYYDANAVTIPNVNFLPLVDTSSALSQYRTGTVDITWIVPVDQYKSIQKEFGSQVNTVLQEGLYYLDFNMTLAKYANNKDLRQALNMAVNRDIIVNNVLGRNQKAAYSYVTPTIEDGKFAGLEYSWATLPHDKQLAMAKELFAKSGYGPKNPLSITIGYNTNDGHKKIALAVAAMWQQAFGIDSIKVTQGNQEWKTFLKARNTANYDIARDGWIADYNSVDSYTNLYYCKSPQNNSKYCNMQYNQLIDEAQATTDEANRTELIKQAITIAQNDYAIIPLFQYTYTHLVNPRVKGYTPNINHFDHVQSKWYKF